MLKNNKMCFRKRLFEIIEPAGECDKASSIYDFFMMIIILISILPLCFKTQKPIFLFIDYLAATIFTIDYLLRMITSDVKMGKKGLQPFLLYPITPFAIIDMLSILPTFVPISMGFRLLRLFRFLRIFRVIRVLRYSKSFNRIINVVKKERRALLTVFTLAIGYVFLAALIMFLVEPDTFNSFFDAIYWSVVTLTTVGYGDIYPISIAGKIFSMVSSFIGIAIVALPTGIITAGYMEEVKKN